MSEALRDSTELTQLALWDTGSTSRRNKQWRTRSDLTTYRPWGHVSPVSMVVREWTSGFGVPQNRGKKGPIAVFFRFQIFLLLFLLLFPFHFPLLKKQREEAAGISCEPTGSFSVQDSLDSIIYCEAKFGHFSDSFVTFLTSESRLEENDARSRSLTCSCPILWTWSSVPRPHKQQPQNSWQMLP